jgi:hypothetical protein
MWQTQEPIAIARRSVAVAELRAVTLDPAALLGSVTHLGQEMPADLTAANLR